MNISLNSWCWNSSDLHQSYLTSVNELLIVQKWPTLRVILWNVVTLKCTFTKTACLLQQ
jgi:hypothetical protein